jgi:hypothetical protein
MIPVFFRGREFATFEAAEVSARRAHAACRGMDFVIYRRRTPEERNDPYARNGAFIALAEIVGDALDRTWTVLSNEGARII